MTRSKVLITTYHQAFLHKAGGEFELFEVALALKKLGVFADIYGPYSRPLGAYDTILHFSVHAGGLELLRMVKGENKRIVLWPNLWLRDASNATLEVIRKHIDLADLIAIKSETEKQHLQSWLPVPHELFCKVYSGVDARYGVPTDKKLFGETHDVSNYILWVGIFEPDKNQLAAVKALRDLHIPMVFIGHARDKNYYDECLRAMPPHFKVLPFLPPKSDLFRSALQGCAAYIEIPKDPPGLSVLEAALAGAPIVVQDNAWTREHLGDAAIYVDPASPDSIRTGVLEALSGRNAAGRQALTERLRENNVFPRCLEALKVALEK
ncbi:glycosyltransferase [Desulfovibrio sp. OttesenSCG-928-M14]|nr:glycosyltransferase [Desulfovibrio sp. OttesenSCG-928-M14]